MNKTFLNGFYQAKTTNLIPFDSYFNLNKLQGKEFLEYLKNNNIGLGSTYANIDEVLNQDLLNVREELNSLTKLSIFGNVFFMDHDLTNFKIIYKSIKYDLAIDELDLVGKFRGEELIQFFKYDNNLLIDQEDLKVLILIKDNLTGNIKVDLELIESIYYNYYYNLVKEDYPSLEAFLGYKRFVNNLNLLFKFRLKDESLLNFSNLLLAEKHVDKDTWINLYTKTEEEIISYFELKFYGKLVPGIKKYFSDKTLTELIKNINEVNDDIITKISFDKNNLGSLVSYIHLKLKENNSLRWSYYEK